MTRNFRVLSLDGGGVKGAFTASVLAALEESTGERLSEHFDLITGTSTGGIIAIGLGLGFSAAELRDFYLNDGPKIFSATSVFGRFGFLKQMVAPKHSSNSLQQALESVLGSRKFGESRCRLLIPTYDAISGRIFMMKTAHHERFVHDIEASAVDVAMATSAAPTYFAARDFPIHENASYVDGGVWANCPAMAGLTEAVAFLGQDAKDVDILSVGTTSSPFSIAEHANSGAVQWNMGLINLMFEAQAETARAQASLLAGGFHRIDTTVETGRFGLDKADSETIRQLVSLGRAEAVKKVNLDKVKGRFLNGQVVEPFVPFAAIG